MSFTDRASLVATAFLAVTAIIPASRLAGQNVGTSAGLILTLDSAMSGGMRRDRIAGGAYVLVSRGRIVASRGFGVADIETRRRVNPDSTTFGLASTTKLLTAVAAARMAREGRIDLDAPIAPYLGNLPLASRVNGITLSRLLTHTAGLDDPTIGSAARSSHAILPAANYLERAITPPWITPGTLASYSNAGVALGGHILSLASGERFEDLIDSAVFVPFGMRHSSVRQPLPATINAARAIPYSASGDRQVPVPRIFFNDVPASAAFATPHDVGLLMSALVAPSTAADSALAASLFSRRFTNHPALPGLTLGFRESADGDGIYEHGGDWQDYSNSLWLDRVSGTGLFAVFSSAEGGRTAADLWAIVRSTLPARPERFTFTTPASRTTAIGCSQVDGTYRDTRMSRHTVARLGVLTGDVREVVVKTSPAGVDVQGVAYQDIGGGVFQSKEGRTVAFRCRDGGEPTHLFRGSQPSASYVKVDPAESRPVQGALVVLAFLGTIAATVTDFRRRRIRTSRIDSIARVSRVVAGLGALLLFLVIVFLLVTTNPWAFQYGMPASLTSAASISPGVAVAVGLAVILSLYAVVKARASSGVLEALLAVPAVLLVIVMVQWNLAPLSVTLVGL